MGLLKKKITSRLGVPLVTTQQHNAHKTTDDIQLNREQKDFTNINLFLNANLASIKVKFRRKYDK